MSGGLLKYSGLVTKTKAMHGRLLEREELLGLSESENVEELISFLKESDAYAPVYESHEEIHHRAQVEAVPTIPCMQTMSGYTSSQTGSRGSVWRSFFYAMRSTCLRVVWKLP